LVQAGERAGASENRKKVRRLEERRTIERHRKKLLLTLAI